MADPLSPADQVMIAVAHVYQEHGGEPPARAVAAAALRAAANQIGMKQPLGETDADAGVFAAHNAINYCLLAIAAELEARPMTTTPTKPMLTKNTSQLRDRVQQHVAADQVIQRTYWDPENQRGCFIGCLNHSNDPSGAENEYGLPIMVQRIAESIFEALPESEAKAFFAALPDAVGCDGKDLSRVGWQFLASELRALPEQPAEIQAVIDPVIAGLELLAAGREWPARVAGPAADSAAGWAAKSAEAAARAAAEAGWAAARVALVAETAEAAGWAAGLAAEAAARVTLAAETAEAAGWAAGLAAEAANRAAVRQRQRELLLRLIAEAPVGEEARQ